MDPEQPKTRLPHHKTVDDDVDTATNIAAGGVERILEEMRAGPATAPTRRRKVTVAPGRSIAVEDLEEGTYSRISFLVRDIFVMYLLSYLLTTCYFYPPDANVSDTSDVDDSNDVNMNAPATKTARKTRTTTKVVPKPKKRGRPRTNPIPTGARTEPVATEPAPLTFQIGDWVVVRFAVQGTTRTRAFIGKFDSVRNGRMWASFLRPHSTRNESGYMYSYPKIKDYSSFLPNQIVKIIDPPTTYLRDGLFLFSINSNDLHAI